METIVTRENVRILFFTLAAVAPLWKRLMVWHDDGVYAIACSTIYVLFRHNTRIHVTFTSTNTHKSGDCVHKSLYSSFRIDIHTVRFFLFVWIRIYSQGGAYFPSKKVTYIQFNVEQKSQRPRASAANLTIAWHSIRVHAHHQP